MLEAISGFVWSSGMIFLLLGTGFIVSLRTSFIQLRVPYIIKRLVSSLKKSGKAQARVTFSALAASMGIGNIAGVTTALSIGGAGALFWMYISAFLGMALTYAENVLSHKYSKGRFVGTMAYLKYGLSSPFMASVYAVLCVIASLGMGNMTQCSAAAESLKFAAGVPGWVTGLIAASLLATALIGGLKSIGSCSSALLPFVSVFYMGTAVIVIIMNRETLPAVWAEIFRSAFGCDAALGGTAGTAISAGLRQGVFSNEAGLGSSGIIHSEADSSDPEIQGLWSMAEVFIDTFLCCTLTALAVLTTGTECTPGMASVSNAFECILGEYSGGLLAVTAALFAVCTMLGWYVCGEKAVRCIGQSKWTVPCYRIVFCGCAFLGAIGSLKEVLAISDIANGLMAVPNLLAILVIGRNGIEHR